MKTIYLVATNKYTTKPLAAFETIEDAQQIAAQLHGEEGENLILAVPYVPTEYADIAKNITGGEHGE